MNKLALIIKREYIAKVRNKSFVVMTILSPVLLVGMVVLIAFLTKVNDSEKRIIAVFNEGPYFSTDFNPGESLSYVHLENITLEQAMDSTQTMGFYGLMYIPEAANVELTAQGTFFYTQDAPLANVVDQLEDIIQYRVRQFKLTNLGLSAEEFAHIDQRFDMQTSTFEGQQNLKGINEIKALIGGGFGYLIMMFIIIYGGFVMRSVIEEKTSRIIEVIISSVKPFQLMLGKIIGTSLAGITQFVIWIISAGFLMVIVMLFFGIDVAALNQGTQGLPAGMGPAAMPEAVDTLQLYAEELYRFPWLMLIVSFVIYFILGYLIYSSIYAAIGAAVDNETDTQQFIFPIILPLMLAIYVGFFSVFGNPHGPIAVGFSLFPLTSPIVMLMRLPSGIGAGGVPVWQLLLSISLLVITFIAIVWLAAKIYRVGILMYGKKPTYKELWKWLKY